MTIYLTSDLHFNHRGILEYCAPTRLWADVTEMNQALIDGWNDVVGPTDTIYVLGDFGFGGPTYLQAIFNQLKGHKHLVVGNHDEKNKDLLKFRWESVNWYRKIRHTSEVDGEKYRIVMSHYPFETWDGAHRAEPITFHVHGHSHGNLKRIINRRYDVGVDGPYGPGPVPIESLIAIAKEQVYDPQDHHGD